MHTLQTTPANRPAFFFTYTPCPTTPRQGFCFSQRQTDSKAVGLEGLSESQAHWQAKKFRDYWQAKSGKEAHKTDWQAP
uniref:hypothetical protein n=1 Tax=Bartonella raoultii TaxID=1457020 RepID=UPI001ABBA709|nr:hypothetical protein [Bartonella raoultii]